MDYKCDQSIGCFAKIESVYSVIGDTADTFICTTKQRSISVLCRAY